MLFANFLRKSSFACCFRSTRAAWEGSGLQRWEAELEGKLRGPGKLTPVTDLMAHVFKESERAFKGSTHEDTFLVFHDALSAWWEKAAQVSRTAVCVFRHSQ